MLNVVFVFRQSHQGKENRAKKKEKRIAASKLVKSTIVKSNVETHTLGIIRYYWCMLNMVFRLFHILRLILNSNYAIHCRSNRNGIHSLTLTVVEWGTFLPLFDFLAHFYSALWSRYQCAPHIECSTYYKNILCFRNICDEANIDDNPL